MKRALNFFENFNFTSDELPTVVEDKDLIHSKTHLKSCRIEIHEKIHFLNGKGSLYIACCEENKKYKFKILEKKTLRPLDIHVGLLLSPPKGKALDQAITQAAEVGYDSLQMLRSALNQHPLRKELSFSRFERILQSACVQCGMPRFPHLEKSFQTLNTSFLEEEKKSSCLVLADESLAEHTQEKHESIWTEIEKETTEKKSLKILIGPEGGWSDSELDLLRQHCHSIDLGSFILRVPTACVAAYVKILSKIDSSRSLVYK